MTTSWENLALMALFTTATNPEGKGGVAEGETRVMVKVSEYLHILLSLQTDRDMTQ